MANSIQLARFDGGLGSVTGVGTTQVGAAALSHGINVLTSTVGQTAAVLPTFEAGPVVVRVTGGTAATVFPPTGGSINGGSANASVSVTSGKVGLFFPHPNGVDFSFMLAA